MIKPLMRRAGLRYFSQNPWLGFLAIFSIALGVAVVTAVDLANQGAMDSLIKTTETLEGGATHRLGGPPGGVPENLYPTILEKEAVLHATPVVEGVVTSPDFPAASFNLFGVDPLSQGPFRPHINPIGERKLLTTIMTRPDAVLMAEETARRLAVQAGDSIQIIAGGKRQKVSVVGLLAVKNRLQREGMASLLLADIATAQELMGLEGRLNRIDLIITEGATLPAPPPGTRITPASQRKETMLAMTESFRLNLSALSLLALLVGMFIIFNTISFSVVRRRRMIGLLRAQGVTRREIFHQLLTEGLMLAVPGTVFGLMFGIVLGHGMVDLVTGTINDLYYHLPPTPLHPGPGSLIKGTILGIGASMLATLHPAYEATTISPVTALSRSSQEFKVTGKRRRHWTLWWGCGLILTGAAMLLLPGKSLFFGFAALALLIVGAAFLAPRATVLLMALLARPVSRLFGLPGKIAVGGVVRNLSRTGIAVAALSVAVATAVGMGLLIHSFRATVELWLHDTLSSDIYISVKGTLSTSGNPELKPETIEILQKAAGDARVGFGRKMVIDTDLGPLTLLILEIPKERFFRYQFKAGDPELLWPQFMGRDSILVSEALAFHKGLAIGDFINLPTAAGVKPFKIGGVIYDYRANAGLMIMNRAVFQRHWRDYGVTNMGINVAGEADIDAMVEKLKMAVATSEQGPSLVIRSNRNLRVASLEIFDRTFAITRHLRLLGVTVAFFGVFTALMAIQLERFREMAIFRALGLTRSELSRIIILETGLLGVAAGLLAIPLGWMQGMLLIHVINFRSFGWSMQAAPDVGILLQALIIAIPTAVIAGIYPARRMAATSPASALREV